MTRAPLLMTLLAPLLMAAAPLSGPILLTADATAVPSSPELCHIRLGMSLPPEPPTYPPVMRALIVDLRASFAAGGESENVRLWNGPPGQWSWREVLFNGNCAAGPRQVVVHVQEAVCAIGWGKYVDCLPEIRVLPGAAPLQIR